MAVVDNHLTLLQGVFGKNALIASGLATYTLLGLGVVCFIFSWDQSLDLLAFCCHIIEYISFMICFS